MKIISELLNGLKLIQPDVFEDDRGYFYESYSKKKFDGIGIYEKFLQDNVSKSTYRTIRGLHYQTGKSAQGKLCHVLSGKVLDVAVDIRFNSPNFGKYASVELSDENHLFLWIPAGFAHGFSVLSEIAIFHYKCTQLYDKLSERCIIYSDPELNIDWKIPNPVVSEKDKQGVLFNSIDNDFHY